jgi:UDP-N-acetylmuramyl pentapeptide phosphotransferase/UDP-N-acetylglucosamine-1-phosphate transferase
VAPLPPLAAALALLPEDLGERAMLGDAGANALGAMLGAAAAGLPRSARLVMLAGIAGLTAASEKVSFTKVIERTPALRKLDMLGRRPADPVPTARIPAQRHRLHDAMSLNGSGTTARSAENIDIAPTEE